MTFTSVSGKNWKFKDFDHSDIKRYTENYRRFKSNSKSLSDCLFGL